MSENSVLRPVGAGERAVPATDNAGIVDRFLTALRDKDFDAAGALLDDDLVYENVGFTTVRGRERTMRLFGPMQRPSLGFDVAIHRSAADGATVLNERTDVLILGPLHLKFWVCGVFEVHDGKITLWRDYFDNLDIAKAFLRGVVGAAVPSLRPGLTR